MRATLHLQNYDQLSFSLPKRGVNMHEYNNLEKNRMSERGDIKVLIPSLTFTVTIS
jgi:hypothetical protein